MDDAAILALLQRHRTTITQTPGFWRVNRDALASEADVVVEDTDAWVDAQGGRRKSAAPPRSRSMRPGQQVERAARRVTWYDLPVGLLP